MEFPSGLYGPSAWFDFALFAAAAGIGLAAMQLMPRVQRAFSGAMTQLLDYLQLGKTSPARLIVHCPGVVCYVDALRFNRREDRSIQIDVLQGEGFLPLESSSLSMSDFKFSKSLLAKINRIARSQDRSPTFGAPLYYTNYESAKNGLLDLFFRSKEGPFDETNKSRKGENFFALGRMKDHLWKITDYPSGQPFSSEKDEELVVVFGEVSSLY